MTSFGRVFCEFVGRFGRQRIVFVVEFGGFDRDVGDDGGSGGRRVSSVKPHSVLRIDLSQPLVERATGNALDLFDYDELGFREQITLYDAVALVERAATDPRIEGIYLQVPMAVPMGISALYELREALAEFREQSGKFVVSYADVYSQGGTIWRRWGIRCGSIRRGVAWQGMASNTVFYKGLFDKLGVRAELVRHGRFKGPANRSYGSR